MERLVADVDGAMLINAIDNNLYIITSSNRVLGSSQITLDIREGIWELDSAEKLSIRVSGWAKEDIEIAMEMSLLKSIYGKKLNAAITKREIASLFESLYMLIYDPSFAVQQTARLEINEMVYSVNDDQTEELIREDAIITVYGFVVNYFDTDETTDVFRFKDNDSFTKELGRGSASFLYDNRILFGTYKADDNIEMSPQRMMTKEEAVVICIRLLREIRQQGCAIRKN